MAEVETENSGTGAAVTQVVKLLVGFDRPFFTAVALAISIMSAFYAFEAGREAALDAYWLSRTEVYLEELNSRGIIKVPADILQHKP